MCYLFGFDVVVASHFFSAGLYGGKSIHAHMFVNKENNNCDAAAAAAAAVFVIVSGDKQTQCSMEMNLDFGCRVTKLKL